MSEKVVTLAELCKVKKVDPKTARRKLRLSEATPKPVNDTRWAFKMRDKAKVLSIIAA